MIDNCPKCDYALAGLPDQYRCPECGTDYDREAVAFPDRPKVTGSGLVYHCLMMLIAALVAWRTGTPWLFVVTGVGLLYIVLVEVPQLKRVEKAGVYVSPRLVQVIRDGTVKTIDMQSVAAVRGSMIHGYVSLYDNIGNELLAISTRSMFLARKIAAQIRAFASDGHPDPPLPDQGQSS